MLYSLGSEHPQLRGTGHFIAPSAAVIGHVLLEAQVSIWFNAVLRGDNELISIGAGSNVQDFAMLHTDPGFALSIGADVTIGHHAVVHGATVGDGSLIGINAVLLNGARIGEHCLIAANALVPEGMEVPAGSLLMGSPARVRRQLSDAECHALSEGARHYVQNAARFARDLEKVAVGD